MEMVRVNTDMLFSDADEMATGIRFIQSDMDKLNECMINLGKMWRGTAHKAFEASFASGYSKMENYLKKLEKIAVRISEESREYNFCENSVRAIVDEI